VGWLTDPVGWWVEPFTDNTFMRNALGAALLTVVCTSVIGTWVVLRGLSFLGDALAHGVLPGIAIAFVLGHNVTVGALVAAFAMVGGINLIRAASPLPDDASIGVLFVGFLALAVVVMSAQRDGGTGDLTRFLFGSVNAVDTRDLARLLVVAAVTVGSATVLYRAFLVGTFDATQARLMGFRPRLTHAVLLVLLALAIVASFETVGSLLVFAFLVAPPATATLLVKRVPWTMLTAVVIGAASATVGLLVSYHERTASGATMALTTVIVFFVALTVTSLHRLVARRRHAAAR
jgi:ABC-type Mn2+/Zn2+ transport system permease subunit